MPGANPSSPPCNRSLVIVGVLTLLASLLGYAGSHFRPQLLLAYLIVGAVGTLAQLAIVLAIFFAQSAVATAIENMNTEGNVTAAVVREKDRYSVGWSWLMLPQAAPCQQLELCSVGSIFWTSWRLASGSFSGWS